MQRTPVNERQAEIINIFRNTPNAMLTVKESLSRFLVTATTTKSNLNGLLHLGLLQEIPLNKVQKGYTHTETFDETLQQLQQNR